MYLCLCIQVIAGAGMDVDFTILSPEGTLLIYESRRSDGVHVLVLSFIDLNRLSYHRLFIFWTQHCWTCLFNLALLAVILGWSLQWRETIKSALTTASVVSQRRWCSLRSSLRVKGEMWVEMKSGAVWRSLMKACWSTSWRTSGWDACFRFRN